MTIAILMRRVLGWVFDGAEAAICDPQEASAQLMAERRAAIVVALGQFVDSLNLSKCERVYLRKEMDVMCGDHGATRTRRYATCPYCGGYAMPLQNETLTERAHVMRMRRRVTAKQNSSLASAPIRVQGHTY